MNHYPVYDKNDNTETRIAKCIRFELEHGGDYVACGKAVVRDIKWGYIRFDTLYEDIR
jgi:hypothetical protein